MKMLSDLCVNWKKSELSALIGVILLVMALFWTSPHWWKKVSEARIAYDGKASPSSSLYRSRDGKLLVHLIESDEEDVFVIYPDTEKVGLPNRSSFFIVPGYAYSKDVPPLVVYMNSAKADGKPELLTQGTFAEFTTTKGSRVRATW